MAKQTGYRGSVKGEAGRTAGERNVVAASKGKKVVPPSDKILAEDEKDLSADEQAADGQSVGHAAAPGLADSTTFTAMMAGAAAAAEGAGAEKSEEAADAGGGGIGVLPIILGVAAIGGGVAAAGGGGSGDNSGSGSQPKPNAAPVVANAIADQTSAEDAAWSFVVPSNAFSDPEGNALTLTATLADGAALPSWLTFNAATRTFSGTPPKDYNGALELKVAASDGTLSVSDVFKLTVTPLNDAPVVTSAAAAAQGSVSEAGNADDGAAVAGVASATGTLTSSDVDANATKAWSVVGTSDATYGQFAVNAETGVWTYTLDNTLAATQALKEGETKTLTYTVRVTDDMGAYADQSVTVTVNGTNDKPVVTNTAAAAQGTVTEAGDLGNGSASFGVVSATGSLTSSDVDANATKSWSVVGTSDATYGSFAVNADTGVWTYTLNNALAAAQALKEGETKTLTYTVRVTDDKGAYADQAVSVVVNGTNDLPVRSAIADTSVTFQEAAPAATTASSQFVKVAGTDADGGLVTFTIPVQPTYGNITLAPDGSGFTYTPKDINYHGSETFMVRLIDAQGNGKYTDYPVTVNVTPNIAENQAIDNGLTKVTYNAAGSGYTAGDNFTFIDDSAQTTNVEIVNFALGDKIQVSASASKYSFAVTTAGDLEITYIDNASGASNVILVKGVAANAGFIYDETTAEAQLGLGNFFVSLADGASNAGGSPVAGTSLDVDSDSNVNTFALFNASAGNIAYSEDASLANRALIQGFGVGDTITVSNAALSAYTFARDTNAGNDVVITYNNGGTINEIVLQGVATGANGPLDTLSAVEALVGTGFFNATSSGGTGGTGGTGSMTTQVIDNASGVATFNAGTDSFKYTDDATVRSDVILQNFGANDKIYTNTALNNYSFAISDTDSKDLVVTFNNNGVPNQIVLDEILAGKDVFIDNYDSAKAAIGFDFMVFG